MPPEPAAAPEIRTAPPTKDARTRILAVIDEHAQGLGLPFDGEPFKIEAWEGETWLGGLTGRTHPVARTRRPGPAERAGSTTPPAVTPLRRPGPARP